MILADKTVMISGVGPGLGGKCAKLALRDGANVVITARNAGRLAEIAAGLDPNGERLLARVADTADQSAVAAAVEAGVDRFGGLDSLVNVAALDTLHGTFDQLDDEAWLRNLEVNVLGAIRAVRAAVPALQMRGGGSIVLIGSQASLKPVALLPQSAYASAKSALLSAARDMAEAVIFFASDRARMITGQRLLVNAGEFYDT